jgi:hypothetical protein
MCGSAHVEERIRTLGGATCEIAQTYELVAEAGLASPRVSLNLLICITNLASGRPPIDASSLGFGLNHASKGPGHTPCKEGFPRRQR